MMKLLLVAVVCTAVAGNIIESEFSDEFELWKSIFRKEYTSAGEEAMRFAVWLNNLRRVEQHNLEAMLHQHSYTLAINELSDLTVAEMSATLNGFRAPTVALQRGLGLEQLEIFQTQRNPQLPSEVDWRKKGAVSDVKNQGQCGSCWAFSATGALEGQHFLKNGTMVDLSEQNLVDCSTSYGNAGCQGGLPSLAFKYIKDNGGIDTETGYPYEGDDETCRFEKTDIGATDNGVVTIPQGDEDALQQAVATIGPISVGIDASHYSFQLYKGGVYTETSCNNQPQGQDHGVLVVGYGTEDGQDYWVVKNSWGASWGEAGYIRMSRNKDNQCGIATDATYPKV